MFVASVVFITILVGALMLWQFATARTDEIDSKQDINMHARFALQALTQMPGEPANWEEDSSFNLTTMRSLGIASKPFSISSRKLSQLQTWNSSGYTDYKTLLGLQGYDFQLRVFPYSHPTTKFSTIEEIRVGKSPSSASTELIRLERTMRQADQWKLLVLEVWK